MLKSRKILSLLLALMLSTAPVVQVLAGAAASDGAGMHAGHAAQPDAVDPAVGHGEHENTCAQHDSCNGTCCASCAQSFTGVPAPLLLGDTVKPVLSPFVHRLSFSSPIFLRERPPRIVSL